VGRRTIGSDGIAAIGEILRQRLGKCRAAARQHLAVIAVGGKDVHRQRSTLKAAIQAIDDQRRRLA
jgi:hypothetical protein